MMESKQQPWLSLLRLVQLADLSQEELDREGWGETHAHTMQALLRDPERWRQWQLCLALEAHADPGVEEADEAVPADLLAWAQRTVAARAAEEAPAAQGASLSLWDRLLRRTRERWQQGAASLQQSLSLLAAPEAGVRARGGLLPVAVFSEVPIVLGDDRCSFTLQQHKVYAFTTYLPQRGYVAVLQMEHEQGEMEYELLYPQHPTHLIPTGPGGVQLFRTQFEVVGRTHFLLLFSEVPFDALAPSAWSGELLTWAWDRDTRKVLARYLLEQVDALEPFLLQIDVEPDA